MYKRYETPYIDYLTTTQRLPSRNKNYISTKTAIRPKTTKKPNLLQQSSREITRDRKMRCKEYQKRANSERRREFFRAKSKGNTSVRPEHKQRHIKC